MAFKRTNFNRLSTKKSEYFASTYKFSKVTNFDIDSDVYVIPLGLETGYYETPCHSINPHKVNGQTIGYNGSTFQVYVKCNGRDEEGNKQDSLCCQLAQLCKEKYPTKEESGKRIIGMCSDRVQLPVLVLGNSLKEQKKSYPISKVAILNDLHSEGGLKFAYLDLSSYTFGKEIVKAYGTKLKEEGILDYDMDDNSEEFFEEMRKRLSETVIKVHGTSKNGFKAAMREYSFFPFSNPAIASQSPEGEREAIIGYRKNTEIMAKINEFLTLFDVEVDNIIQSWDEKSLQEYFNSAMGLDLKTGAPKETTEPEQPEQPQERVQMVGELSNSDEAELDADLSNLDSEEPEPATSAIDFEYNEDEGDFFNEDEDQ